MPATFSWSLVSVDCLPARGDLRGVVVTARWQVDGSDGDYSASIRGTTHIPLDPDAEFTPVENLTPGQVLGWAKAVMDAQPETEPVADARGNPRPARREPTTADIEESASEPD